MDSQDSDPLRDPARLEALRQSALLDSRPEESFDRLTRLAARVLRVPVALVSLVDGSRQFFKSQAGLPEPLATVRQTPLTHSFCRHVVICGKPLFIEDAREHPLVKENLAVLEMGVIAYAGFPLRSPEGHVLGSFCVIDFKPRAWTQDELHTLEDLAASVISEVVLKRARDAAEAANRAKDRFLAVLSHELRTPVSPALMIAAAMADDGSLTPEVRQDARTIQRNIAQQTRLIDDLLDVTRIENNKLALHFEIVDLHDALRECVKVMSVEAAEKGIELMFAPAPVPYALSGDAGRLRQLFVNLLKNAVKFTPAGGRVIVSTADGLANRVVVSVADTGIGVEADVLEKIFDPFEQGARAITNEFSGLGLGLAICKGVAEAHGGSIAAASEGRGRGTTLTVELPTVALSRLPTPAPVVVTENLRVKRPGLSILLVDDHADTLRAMSRLLRKLDHQVTTAESKSAALSAAADGDFHLLISDIGLPDGTGLDLMRELRERRPMKGIALTGYGTESDVQMTREAGFATHLTKPIDFDDLVEAIDRVGP